MSVEEQKIMGRRKVERYCSRCGKNKHHARGLCVSCYGYKARNGKDRPLQPWAPKPTRIPAPEKRRCNNCFRDMTAYPKRALCYNCQRYQDQHGHTRPLSWRYCWNCGLDEGGQRSGLCKKCLCYRRRNGCDRPEHIYNRGFCRRCGREKACKTGLCCKCYQYQGKYGKPRPSYLWADACVDCGNPKNGRRLTRGRCPTCYAYWRATGRTLPKDLIVAVAPLGWCECGKPAIKVATVQAGAYVEEFPLCADCAKDA